MSDSSQVDRAGWLLAAARRLALAKTDAPRLEAELMLAHGLGVSRTHLVVHPEMAVPEAMLPCLESLLARRERGEPMAYLLGAREFYGRTFAVTPDTLIPRPETEHLVELALERCPEEQLVFADLGTGSGCIAITLCCERPDWRGLAVDRSMAALAVTRQNIHALGVRQRLAPVQGDFQTPLLQPCDLIVSNPPYIAQAEYNQLDPGVRLFEPETALTPGLTGLEHLRPLVTMATACLKPGGWLLLEHAHDQGAAVGLLLKNNFWENVFCFSDLSGHDRVSGAQRSDVYSQL